MFSRERNTHNTTLNLFVLASWKIFNFSEKIQNWLQTNKFTYIKKDENVI